MSQELAAKFAAIQAHRAATSSADTLGLACLGRLIFEGGTMLTQVWEGLIGRLTNDPEDWGALLDLSTLVQMRGDREKGLELQATALAGCRCYRTAHGTGQGVRVLAFMTAGDLMANTPIDFLLEGSDVELTAYYLDGAAPSLADVPEHDIAFLAIGQSDDGSHALRGLAGAFDAWPRPVLNGRAELIAALTRDGVANQFADHPLIICPATRRVERSALEQVADRVASMAALGAGLQFPVIVRPIGSHAGNGLEKLEGEADLAAYLAAHAAAEFFVAAFFDYSGADGLFRKLRIVFVNGRPFVSHMAVSARWMVHYLNADMEQADHRAEEAQVMANFDEDFAARHRQAFQALTEGLGLDYFGIDCAETQDGRLVVFETDVAMIVHAMDPEDQYPYKKPAMAKLFAAFIANLTTTAELGRLAA